MTSIKDPQSQPHPRRRPRHAGSLLVRASLVYAILTLALALASLAALPDPIERIPPLAPQPTTTVQIGR